MSRLRLANDNDLDKSKMKPFLNLRHLGEVYMVVAPCDKGLNLVFIKMIATGAPPASLLPEHLPKQISGEHIHVGRIDKILGVTLKSKVKKAIGKWVRRLKEYDDIMDSTGAKFITFIIGEDS